MQATTELISITDPGKVGKDQHNRVDTAVVRTSNIFAWLFPILMIAICAQVVLRTSGMNQAWLDDLQWWLYGVASLMAIGYAVTTNSHVRVDIFYEHFTPARKCRLEVFALVWLFLPFVILSWDITLPYALQSFSNDEGSDSPNGLHNLWILKIVMNLSFVFIAVATWAAYVRFLAKSTYPALWRQFLYAFPSTFYIANLILYYAIWHVMRLISPAEMSDREVSRLPIFGTFNVGAEEIKFTVFAAFVVTIITIGVARVFTTETPKAGSKANIE